jgi:hypothetical protein
MKRVALALLAGVALGAALARSVAPAVIPARPPVPPTPAAGPLDAAVGAREQDAGESHPTPTRHPGDEPGIPGAPPAASPAPARYSTYRDLSPFDEIDRAVGLAADQRPEVELLVVEREALMHATYADAALGGGDLEKGIDAVKAIYETYSERIRERLEPAQRVRYDAARREGRIGRPLFVFRYGDSQ